MIVAGLGMPFVLGEQRDLTWVVMGRELVWPVYALPPEMTKLFTADFFAITVLTLFAPVLCFVLEHWRTPLKLFGFLAKSTALYAALSPLSAICVAGYALTGKARFLVTGDASSQEAQAGGRGNPIVRYLTETHPSSPATWIMEVAAGAIFLSAAIVSFQPAFAGLALAFMLQPLLHGFEWDKSWLRRPAMLPFTVILASVGLGGASLFGLQPVLFGFGFHF